MITKVDENSQFNLHSTYDKSRKYLYSCLSQYDLSEVNARKLEAFLIINIALLSLDLNINFIKCLDELRRHFLRFYFIFIEPQ